MEIGAGRIAGAAGLVVRVIPKLHAEMAEVATNARFAPRVIGGRRRGETPRPGSSGRTGEGGSQAAKIERKAR